MNKLKMQQDRSYLQNQNRKMLEQKQKDCNNPNSRSAYFFIGLVLWILFGFLLWGSYSPNVADYISKVIEDDPVEKSMVSTCLESGLNRSNHNDPNDIKIITWNLQGLLSTDLMKRTEAVIRVIKKESPDGILLQELVPSTFQLIAKSMKKNYSIVLGTDQPKGYFTGILFKKSRLVVSSSESLKNSELIPYKNTVMSRTLLITRFTVKAFKKIKLALLTTHLESLPRFRTSRVDQLQQCFEICKSLPKAFNVIFGGDLNLEDNEEAGVVPKTILDTWQECGSQESTKYTYDSTKNNNEQPLDDSQQPRTRYDRLYFRKSKPETLELKNFQLLGKERVKGSEYFPSDHWLVMSTFQFIRKSNSSNVSRRT